ncbi:MAG TPA: UbiA family prenyltransferase [Dongiaceae bacterium]|nr:UbiA family prenyltransferase [Dongiaceae bacterium]
MAEDAVQRVTRPLVIDLDGTLVRTDLLYESYFNTIADGPAHHWAIFRNLLKGKAPLKAYLASASTLDYKTLPYEAAILDLIGEARREGRPIYLATASDQRHAEAVAEHLGGFDGVIASDGVHDLSSQRKADRLCATLGGGNFDYVGDRAADLAAWQHAAIAYAIGTRSAVLRRLRQSHGHVEEIPRVRSTLRDWLRALRIHQYAKNALIFVPPLAAHRLDLLFPTLIAFIAFSFCASSAYLLNDLVDLKADRTHLTKHMRPLAHGDIPIAAATFAIPILFAAAAALAASVSLELLLILLLYCAVTAAYSLYLKRKVMVDVIVLAGLYTIRVVAGGAATDLKPSEWLLGFSILIFTSLALIKRYVELTTKLDRDLPDTKDRGYRIADMDVMVALAAASGVNAITVLAFYISSSTVASLYSHPLVLWLICPLVLYWLSRVLIVARRRKLHDDPIVFALKDWVSWWVFGLVIVVVLSAI